ncbi:LolA family protein [Moheibacter lacus]|uniref:Outer membrane lipoprotein carrier protein LolA n=1 Tax=Moheibacter lacus TaxID=2745851 RepID=A0A838ZPK9_9FLAO|nr:outer membrane lipoprotein carrier protein LolA [Moheibacter lacus]MBA5628785.1 outer membrane lipoprotein carrier protein LolA [Moheibacter lacus]
MNKLFFFFMLIGVFAQAQLSSSEIKTLKSNINAATADLKSLQSDFVQTKHLDFMENDVKSNGKLFYKANSKIRWEYTTPFHYYVIFNNEKMFVNDNGKKKETELSKSKLLKDLNKIMLGTVQGANVLDETKFKISYAKSGSNFLAKMLPIDKTIKKYIQQIDLTFDGKTYLLKKIKTIEPSLDYTLIEFSNQKKNATVPEDKFAFK